MKPKIVIEEFSSGHMIIKEIHGSEKLRTNAGIRKAVTESTLKSRARGMSFTHRLSNVEVTAAIYKKHSESDEGDERV